MTDSVPLTGLVLTGGGARAAYQVGVLKAIAQVRKDSGAAGGPPGAQARQGALLATRSPRRADRLPEFHDARVRQPGPRPF